MSYRISVLIIILCLISDYSLAQVDLFITKDKVELLDKNKSGYVIELNRIGKILKVYFLENGLKNNFEIVFDKKGFVEQKSLYINDSLISTVKQRNDWDWVHKLEETCVKTEVGFFQCLIGFEDVLLYNFDTEKNQFQIVYFERGNLRFKSVWSNGSFKEEVSTFF